MQQDTEGARVHHLGAVHVLGWLNATGAGGNRVFFEGDINVTNSYTITTGRNAMSAGPITLDSNVVVTIPAGSVWTVV